MPRPTKDTSEIHFRLASTQFARLRLYLYSEAEKRIPYSAYGNFFSERLTEFFSRRDLDLSPYLGTLPNECVISGNDLTLSKLVTHLKSLSTHLKEVNNEPNKTPPITQSSGLDNGPNL